MSRPFPTRALPLDVFDQNNPHTIRQNPRLVLVWLTWGYEQTVALGQCDYTVIKVYLHPALENVSDMPIRTPLTLFKLPRELS